MPVYDAESMDITARKMARIAEDFRASGASIGKAEGQNPFGDVEDPDDPDKAAGTLGSFSEGLRAEFDTAARRVSAAGAALRDAVRAMSEADAVAAENLTARDR